MDLILLSWMCLLHCLVYFYSSAAESCSLAPLSNAVKHFIHEGVIQRSEVSADHLLLSEGYANDSKKLSGLVESIAQFRRV